MLQKLDQLSRALGVLTTEEAKQVIDAVNRKIADSRLHPHVIRLYWRQSAQEGVILEPISFINNSSADDPKPFPLHDQPAGELSWVYHNDAPLWVEDCGSHDREAPLRNLATDEDLPPDYFDFPYEPDSMMAVPLSIRDQVKGVFSIELPRSGRFNSDFLKTLQEISRALVLILWNADTHDYNLYQTRRAIDQFHQSIEGDRISIEPRLKTGFFARPFTEDSAEVEGKIMELLEGRDVIVRHYQPQDGGRVVVEDLLQEIGDSQFGIADLTGASPNVLIEIGVLISQDKKFLLLRERGDDSGTQVHRPFNLNLYQIYEYQIKKPEGELQVWDPANRRYDRFESVLDEFLEELPVSWS